MTISYDYYLSFNIRLEVENNKLNNGQDGSMFGVVEHAML
jgi:hypothetical protein